MKKVENIIWQAKIQKNTNWLQVRTLLEQAIREYPKEKELYIELADLYMEKKLFKRAIKHYQTALNLTGNDDVTFFKVGNCFLSIDEYQLAIDYYSKIYEEFPELLYNKAYAYSKIDQIELSIQILEKLLKFKIASEIPYIFLAELYFMKNQYDKAIEYLTIAEQTFGKQASLYYLRALAYSHEKNYLKAYIEFQRADKLKINTSHFYKSYGLVCENIGKTQQAIDNLLTSIKLAPNDASGYIELIKIYLSHNRIMEAFTIAQHAKRNVPYTISLSLLHKQISNKMGDKIKNKK